MGKGNPVPMPDGAPKAGEVFKHYKQGDLYKVIGIALGSADSQRGKDEWLVVYEPMYEMPAAPMFARPLAEWQGEVEWERSSVPRFQKI